MNLNLKRRLVDEAESENKGSASKRNRSNAFFSGEDDDDGDNDGSSFQEAVSEKASRIKRKLMTAANDFEESESEDDSSDGAQQIKRSHGDNSGSSYIESLRRSRKERAQVREVSRQEAANKLVNEYGSATVFESDNYKKHKQHIDRLKLQEEEQDDQEKDDSAFYSAMLQARERGARGVRPAKRLSEDNHNSGSELTAAPGIDEIKTTPLPSYSSATKRQSGQTLDCEEHTTTMDEDYTRLINTIKHIIKTNVTSNDIEEYKNRYWKRRSQISDNRNHAPPPLNRSTKITD